MLAKLRGAVRAARENVHRHADAWKRAHHATHLAYFAAVASHGPYHIAALALLVLGIVFWLAHVEA